MTSGRENPIPVHNLNLNKLGLSLYFGSELIIKYKTEYYANTYMRVSNMHILNFLYKINNKTLRRPNYCCQRKVANSMSNIKYNVDM